MGIGKIFLATGSLVTSLALLQTSQAQDSPQDFLNAHNQARASVGVPPLIWDNDLAFYARLRLKYMKDRCEFIAKDGSTYGENLSRRYGDVPGTAVVKSWVNQRPNYDYIANSCIGQRPCNSYINVIWSKTVGLGCAKVRCSRGTIVSCNYDPRSNITGERPYSVGNLLLADYLSKRK